MVILWIRQSVISIKVERNVVYTLNQSCIFIEDSFQADLEKLEEFPEDKFVFLSSLFPYLY